MNVTKVETAETFKSFSLVIEFQTKHEVELFNALIKKVESDVKRGGLYWNIVQQIDEAMGS